MFRQQSSFWFWPSNSNPLWWIADTDNSWGRCWLETILEVIKKHDVLKMLAAYIAVMAEITCWFPHKVFTAYVDSPSFCSNDKNITHMNVITADSYHFPEYPSLFVDH